jgi:hypothetical protein
MYAFTPVDGGNVLSLLFFLFFFCHEASIIEVVEGMVNV